MAKVEQFETLNLHTPRGDTNSVRGAVQASLQVDPCRTTLGPVGDSIWTL